MKAEPEHLIDLMFDNKRQYQIPVYQRNYDWKKDNCAELYNDVILAYNKEKSHFLGTIVQVQKDEEHGIKQFIIIDGQQRLTSIYLLLKALFDLAKEEDDRNILKGLLYNYSDVKQFGNDEKNKLKLKPIKSDNEQFLLLMNDKYKQLDKSSNICINYHHFCDLVEKSLKQGYTIKNIIKGLKYFEIVMISLKEEAGDEPQVVFERINSTGEDLTLADLIRNYVLMTDKNSETLFEEYWLPMENLIGKNRLDDYFLNYLIFKVPDVNEKISYQSFKKYADRMTHEQILNELKCYANYYNVFVRTDYNNYSKEVNNVLGIYRVLNQTTIYPFLFPIFNDFKDNIIDEQTLLNILLFFINYTLRRAVTGVPTNSLRGFYKSLYKRIFDNGDKDNYLDSIYNFMATIPSDKDAVPNDAKFKESLLSANIYKNNKLCKYLLSVLENGFKGIKEKITIDDSITIEHIMPQNRENLDWQKEIGKDFLAVYDKYVHTLGNLTLTGYNSELSDKKFLDKVELLKDNSKFVYLNEDVIDKEYWNAKTITARAQRLSAKLVKEFKLPDIFGKQIVVDNINQKHTVIDGTDYTGTLPTSFILINENRNVASYKDVLVKTCELLVVLDYRRFESLAKYDFKLPQAVKTYISYDKDKLRTPIEISDTGIYIETNLNANAAIRFIKGLLEEFNLSYDDFILYTTKSN